jgi:leucyl-tRNA synthetase
MDYGTGAIMAVPGHDTRDFEFAERHELPILRVVAKSVEESDRPLLEAEPQPGFAVNSQHGSLSLDGLPTDRAKTVITEWLEAAGLGKRMINYKLRDWLFSRQRYWGEPFPIVLDESGQAHALEENDLPVLLPELEDFKPSGKPEPPLAKAKDWVRYSENALRETNTMPQWAGSCWYYLRYLDPKNPQRAWDPEIERYWMPVDLYIGGAEHAVLHLLYSRFWHKVIFDRGYVSTAEPFQRLVNQGMILGEVEYTAYQDRAGRFVSAADVETCDSGYRLRGGQAATPARISEEGVVKRGDAFVLAAEPSVRVEARAHKMSKSRGNVINPDDIVAEYGADSLRLYEMFMGPLEATKPWSMKGVEGVSRFLGRAWRMIMDERAEAPALDPKVKDVALSAEQAKLVARTVAGVTEDFEHLRFNTAIAKLMEFTNAFTTAEVRPRAAMATFVLLLSPLAPHLGEELWEALGHARTLAYEPWPTYDPALLVDDELEIPVQVNGKIRARIRVAASAGTEVVESAAREAVAAQLDGKEIKKRVVVPGKLVNFVVAG